MILCRINKGVCLCLFGHANTRKHVYEHSCLSVRVFLSILAHLAHLAQSFFLILNGINRYMFWYVSEHANTRKHLSEHCCSSVGVFISILAHLTHLAQSFVLILNGINKCFDVSMQIQESMSVSIAGHLVEWFWVF